MSDLIVRQTQETLDFLESAIHLAAARNQPYAIIPDCPACWVKSKNLNPLLIDWPIGEELYNDGLKKQVFGDMLKRGTPATVIVQKVEAAKLAQGMVPINPISYRIADGVLRRMVKIDEMQYFAIYQPGP